MIITRVSNDQTNFAHNKNSCKVSDRKIVRGNQFSYASMETSSCTAIITSELLESVKLITKNEKKAYRMSVPFLYRKLRIHLMLGIKFSATVA